MSDVVLERLAREVAELRERVDELQQYEARGGTQVYSLSNISIDRSYDAHATTLEEIADVLGTLIDDLRALGFVE